MSEELLSSRKPNVSLILAVINEKENISILLDKLNLLIDQFGDIIKELIVVDGGSTDGSIEYIREYANIKNKYETILIEIGKKTGTVHSQLAGVKVASSDYVLVMDADLQHPPDLIPVFLNMLEKNTDLIIASRYLGGGECIRAPYRGVISRGAALLSKVLIPEAHKLTDPMSGYFLVKRDILLKVDQTNHLYKLALNIISFNPDIKVKEIPYIR